jgi:hypothetical protein
MSFANGISRRILCVETMRRFCKTLYCPTSENLVAFQGIGSDRGGNTRIQRHLGLCEFCDLEAEFYALYPPIEETVHIDAIPAPLFELAEALLKKRRDVAPLYELIGRGD